jgi:hypothetical protein
MPKLAENPLVKKQMTKIKSCTKKYRKAVRAYYKASAALSKHRGTAKRRETLYKKSQNANEKADKVRDECREPRDVLEYMMRTKNVVKQENKEKIPKLIAELDKDEMDWSSNTSSDLSAMQ